MSKRRSNFVAGCEVSTENHNTAEPEVAGHGARWEARAPASEPGRLLKRRRVRASGQGLSGRRQRCSDSTAPWSAQHLQRLEQKAEIKHRNDVLHLCRQFSTGLLDNACPPATLPYRSSPIAPTHQQPLHSFAPVASRASERAPSRPTSQPQCGRSQHQGWRWCQGTQPSRQRWMSGRAQAAACGATRSCCMRRGRRCLWCTRCERVWGKDLDGQGGASPGLSRGQRYVRVWLGA